MVSLSLGSKISLIVFIFVSESAGSKSSKRTNSLWKLGPSLCREQKVLGAKVLIFFKQGNVIHQKVQYIAILWHVLDRCQSAVPVHIVDYN